MQEGALVCLAHLDHYLLQPALRNLPTVSNLGSSFYFCPFPQSLASNAQVLSSPLGQGCCRLSVQVWVGGWLGRGTWIDLILPT